MKVAKEKRPKRKKRSRTIPADQKRDKDTKRV
jgi:hypothetical protein